jgi:hypothetical protein
VNGIRRQVVLKIAEIVEKDEIKIKEFENIKRGVTTFGYNGQQDLYGRNLKRQEISDEEFDSALDLRTTSCNQCIHKNKKTCIECFDEEVGYIQ